MALVRDLRSARSDPISFRPMKSFPLIPVKVGDVVGFKSDFEQSGKIVAINGDRLTLRNESGFGGEYLRYAKQTIVRAQDCWVE